jgi:hypothetical protein
MYHLAVRMLFYVYCYITIVYSNLSINIDNCNFDLTAKTPQRQAIRRISGVSGTLDAVPSLSYPKSHDPLGREEVVGQ